MITKPSADHTVSVYDPRSVFWEQPLPGRVDAAAENAPVSAVCMSANGEIHLKVTEIGDQIFGMVTEQDLQFSIGLTERLQRIRVRSVLLAVNA